MMGQHSSLGEEDYYKVTLIELTILQLVGGGSGTTSRNSLKALLNDKVTHRPGVAFSSNPNIFFKKSIRKILFVTQTDRILYSYTLPASNK